MDYRQAENYILSFTDYEKIPGIAYTSANYDLRRMEKLLQEVPYNLNFSLKYVSRTFFAFFSAHDSTPIFLIRFKLKTFVL